MTTPRLPFVRFHDLKAHQLQCDLHVHTTRTDGEADIQKLLWRAGECGLTRLAFTEHVRRATDWFDDFVQEVRAASTVFPQLQVWVGCEAKALDTRGAFDASPELLNQCDIVLGSVHRFPDGQGGLLDFAAVPQEDFAQIEFDLAQGLLEAAPIDVLAHPGGMYARRFKTDLPASLMRELLEHANQRAIAVEINSSYTQDLPGFLALCAEVNPYVSIGSDVHRVEKLGHCRDLLIAHGVGIA